MWIQAAPDHIPRIETAFAEQREQRPHEYVSYLAEPGIADFHRDRLISRIKKNPNNSKINLLISENRLQALIGVEESEWHKKLLGVTYYKIQPFFCFASQASEIERVATALRALFTGPDAVYTTRVEARQPHLAYYLARQNFTPVGTSIRMVCDDLPQKRVDSQSSQTYDTYKFRPYSETDLPELQNIIRWSHRHSHFFCETRFEPGRVRELFAEWIAQCAKSPAFRITIAESGGTVIGFCSAFVQKSLESYIGRPIGVIDFIVVDSRIQGKGIGRALLEAAFDGFRPATNCIELRTMADNLQAIRFYEKNGFRMLSADQHFHLWTA